MKRGIIIILCFMMVLICWFANDVLHNKEATAEKTIEYKVIPPGSINISSGEERAKALEKILNDNAKDGWKLHSFAGPIIFER
jgi:hypothetical protein